MQIYVLKDGQYVKVGISFDVLRRMLDMQGGNPRQISICHEVEAGDKVRAQRTEFLVHKLLEERCERAMGEWFRTTPRKALQAIQEVLEAMKQDSLALVPQRRRVYVSRHSGPFGL